MKLSKHLSAISGQDEVHLPYGQTHEKRNGMNTDTTVPSPAAGERVEEPAQQIEQIQNVQQPVDSLRTALLDMARAQLGRKYRYGGIGPDAFDCSGLMYFVFGSAGISLPRSSSAQYEQAGWKLDPGEPLEPCDLVFFSGSQISSTVVGHVGMVVDYDAASGSFTFIHAPRTGAEVQTSTSDYYARRYIGAARVLDR